MRRRSATAEYLSAASRQAIAGRTPAQRADLSLALGLDGLAIYARASGLGVEEARRRLQRMRQLRRRRSACIEALGS